MLLGEVQVEEVFSVGIGKHVAASRIHYRHSRWEVVARHLGDPLPVGAHLLRSLDDEHSFMAAATTLARYSLGEDFAYVHMAEQRT